MSLPLSHINYINKSLPHTHSHTHTFLGSILHGPGPEFDADKDVANFNMMTTICKKYLIYLPKKKPQDESPNSSRIGGQILKRRGDNINNKIKCASPAALMASGWE